MCRRCTRTSTEVAALEVEMAAAMEETVVGVVVDALEAVPAEPVAMVVRGAEVKCTRRIPYNICHCTCICCTKWRSTFAQKVARIPSNPCTVLRRNCKHCTN